MTPRTNEVKNALLLIAKTISKALVGHRGERDVIPRRPRKLMSTQKTRLGSRTHGRIKLG